MSRKAPLRQPRTLPRFDLDTFTACVRMLRAGLKSLSEGSFGRQPSYSPEINHYSKAIGMMFGHFQREKVLAVRDELLGEGRIYNLRKPEQLAELRCQVAERLLDEL